MSVIYHISTAADWNTATQSGHYVHPSLQTEGFIHCSQDHQVAGVLERYFEGQTALVKLVIDTDKLTAKYIYDWSPSTQDTFPHIYGPINLDAIVEVIPL
jgi:uncharacterized protein (DUF952 family)